MNIQWHGRQKHCQPLEKLLVEWLTILRMKRQHTLSNLSCSHCMLTSATFVKQQLANTLAWSSQQTRSKRLFIWYLPVNLYRLWSKPARYYTAEITKQTIFSERVTCLLREWGSPQVHSCLDSSSATKNIATDFWHPEEKILTNILPNS